ncbi:recQ-mediated genome instability protein 1 [Engraulis encrasicolus]|uniref:recQ-mediated genome instability protein 1 n=1 Tax=Engraulis encrasicolus TaxID=184585 RepID=UPI002FCFCC95
MAPDPVQAVGSWLRSRWQVSVPEGWLQACVDWLQQEAGGRHLGLTQLQQQTLEQWLQTDLRTLDMPSLPANLGQELKTELQGNVCVQLDSMQDVSQPAYTQLQRIKGSDCANDQIGAETQATQRSWQANPTRMLLLQLTDGVRGVEAMEHKPVPQLNTGLPPGTKLLLRGPIACRLGVLLLGPQNVQVLGGEVEELHTRAHVLCRALGLPEPQPAEEEEEDEGVEAGRGPISVPQRRPAQAGGAAPAPAPAGPPDDDDLDDMELMASLEGVEEGASMASMDSGYRSAASRGASMLSTASSSRPSTQPQPQPQPFPMEEDDPGWWSPSDQHGPMEHEQQPEEDFQDDDIPLEELDDVLSQNLSQDAGPHGNFLSPPPTQGNFLSPPEPVARASSSAQVPVLRAPLSAATTRVQQEYSRQETARNPAQFPALRAPLSTTATNRAEQQSASRPGTNNSSILPHHPERIATVPPHVPASLLRPAANGRPSPGSSAQDHNNGRQQQGSEIPSHPKPTLTVSPALRPPAYSNTTRLEQDRTHLQPDATATFAGTLQSAAGRSSISISGDNKPRSDGGGGGDGGSVVAWDGPPFTYLATLPTAAVSDDVPREVRVHAFVVTLKSNMRSGGGQWGLDVSLSDGSAYADAELADGVLEGLIGLSAAEARALKRTPEGQASVTAGVQKCQRALVDLCGIMTLRVGGAGRDKPLVVAVAAANQSDCLALQKRVEMRRARC